MRGIYAASTLALSNAFEKQETSDLPRFILPVIKFAEFRLGISHKLDAALYSARRTYRMISEHAVVTDSKT